MTYWAMARSLQVPGSVDGERTEAQDARRIPERARNTWFMRALTVEDQENLIDLRESNAKAAASRAVWLTHCHL